MYIVEIFIYVLLAAIMFVFAKKSELLVTEYEQIYDKPYTKIDHWLLAYMLFFTIISAIRWRVGADSEAYIEIFRKGVVRDHSTEYIWDWLVKFVYNNDFHFTVGTGIAAFLQIIFLTVPCRKYRYILVWLPIVLFGGRYFLDLMNGVRQMIVACGLVFLSPYIINRKLIIYVGGIFFLSLIHQSALMLLPLYLLTYIPFNKLKLSNRKYICLAIFIVCFVIGQTPSFQEVGQYLDVVLETTGYTYYKNYYSDVLSGSINEKLRFGPTMLSFLLTSVIVIWYSPILYEKYNEDIKCFELWYFFSFLYSSGYFLVCNLSHMMIRPFQYFELFGMIMLALLLYTFYTDWNKYRLRFFGLILIIWMTIGASMYKAVAIPSELATYKTYFNRL